MPAVQEATSKMRISKHRRPVMKALEAGMSSCDRVPGKPEKLPGKGMPSLMGSPYHGNPVVALGRSRVVKAGER